jgi:hypothetical protein
MNRTAILGTVFATLLLATGNAAPSQPAGQTAPRKNPALSEAFLEVLEQSQKSGKGVLIYLGTHAIGGAVTKISEQTVELKSREYGRIVLRIDRIDGVAAN